MRIKREQSLFLASWEIKSRNLDRVLEKAKDLRKKMETTPGDFPRSVCGPFTLKRGDEGFQVLEADPDQLDNLMDFWSPEMALIFEPITRTRLWETGGSRSRATKNSQKSQSIPIQ